MQSITLKKNNFSKIEVDDIIVVVGVTKNEVDSHCNLRYLGIMGHPNFKHSIELSHIGL